MNVSSRLSIFSFEIKIIHLILMIEFVHVRGGNELSNVFVRSSLDVVRADQSCVFRQQNHFPTLLHHLRMGIVNDNDVIQHVDLTQTERVLANGNLPVWILNSIVDMNNLQTGTGDELELNHEVMNRLGKFTPYQDAETSSAAMYFDKRQEYDGMIGYEFFIRKLPLDKIHTTKETLIPLGKYGVHRRQNYVGHRFETDFLGAVNIDVGMNYQKDLKTYGSRVYSGFPEILVIVSWDVHSGFTQNVDEDEKYTTIVSHILTLFNGVDMLYSKLKDTNIKINIAGIIIEKERNYFSFLQQCRHSQIRKSNRVSHKWVGSCINRLFAQYLSVRKGKIPLHSYDLVIYFTRKKLFNLIPNGATNQGGTFVAVTGTARCSLGLYNLRMRGRESILVASITTVENFGEYATTAHELAHHLSVLHDIPPYLEKDGTCCGHLMRPNVNGCINCLSWSKTSEKTFSLFFSSPNCCAFINEPISLYPPGRQKKLTADEQCRCYGYESAKVFDMVPDNFCQVKLQCKGADNEFLDTVVPMDGTPCLVNKVCWLMKCEEIQVSK